MTDQSNSDAALVVTQEDRDAAARLVRSGYPGGGNGNKIAANEIKGGLHDRYFIVQTLARHRIAAPIATPAADVGLEAATSGFASVEEGRNAWIDLLRGHSSKTPEGLRLNPSAVVALADLLAALAALSRPSPLAVEQREAALVAAAQEARNTLHGLRMGHRADITATIERLDAALASSSPSKDRE